MRRRVDWPLIIVAVLILIIVAAFGSYLTHRAALADRRAEQQRQGMCAMLTLLPTTIPGPGGTAVNSARADYRCGPPRPPEVNVGKPTPAPRPKVIVKVPKGRRHVKVIREPGPVRTVTVRPHHHTRKHHLAKPAPSPSPSSCLLCLPNGKVPPGRAKKSPKP